ncbi:hypothetical protein CIHG_02937 [Coccidioides immitis H538.4]|nr:hypothetical protein CIHG_02937 [Coccidioides immitis H538.4]
MLGPQNINMLALREHALAKLATHVPFWLSSVQLPRQYSLQPDILCGHQSNMLLEVELYQHNGKVKVDLSKPSGKQAALRAIQDDRYIILRGAADTGSIEEVKDNKHTIALLSRTSGKFEASLPVYIPAFKLKNKDIQCFLDWEKQAEHKAPNDLACIVCYHLWRDAKDEWEWEYDKGLWKEETGEKELVEAFGGDL